MYSITTLHFYQGSDAAFLSLRMWIVSVIIAFIFTVQARLSCVRTYHTYLPVLRIWIRRILNKKGLIFFYPRLEDRMQEGQTSFFLEI